MFESQSLKRFSPFTLAGGVLVVAGLMLTAVNWGFLVLVAVGAFGPGLLRELGWVRDKDELQLQAARRAGYHAFLAGGTVSILLIAWVRDAAEPLSHLEEIAPAILVVMWFVWLFSSLFAYWGPAKTALRVLVIFGLVWLLFNILANTGSQYQGMTGLVLQSLLALPFFLLAWLAGIRPRLAGSILIGCSAFFFYFFHLYEIFGPDPLAMGRIIVVVLFIGPLLACGLMLLKTATPLAKQGDEDEIRI